MERWRRVSGKADGKLDLLVVRAYNYSTDVVNGILDKVTELWHSGLVIPPNTKLVSLRLPPAVKWYRDFGAGWGFRAKFLSALEEYKAHPAQWLVIVDADVLPTRETALVELHTFLTNLPRSVQAATRYPILGATEDIGELRRWWVYTLRASINGISISPSMGVFALRHGMLPHISLSYALGVIKASDELYLSTEVFFISVVSFPKYLCEIYSVKHPPSIIGRNSPAFLHFAGGNDYYHAYARVVTDCWDRIFNRIRGEEGDAHKGKH